MMRKTLRANTWLPIVLVTALLASLASWVLFTLASGQGNTQFVTNAQLLQADFTGHASLAPESLWRDIALPRSWSGDPLHPAESREAWYRVPLPAAYPQAWNQLLILRHMMNIEIWLDEHYLGSAGPIMRDVLQRNWNRPFVWSIPEQLLTGGEQMLYFRLYSEQNFGVMSPFILGTEQAVQRRYHLNYFLQIDLVKISLLAMLFIGCLSLFVWLRNRQNNWLLTGMMSLSWSLPLLYILLPSVPLAEFNFLRVSHWGTVSGAFFLLAFIYTYYLNVPLNRLKWLVVLPVLHAALLIMTPDQQVVVTGSAGQLLAQLLFVVLIVQLLARPALRNSEVYSIVAGLLVMLLAAAHDVSLALSGSIERWRWDMFVSYITQPLMMIIIAWQGIRSLLNAKSDLSQLNQQLQLRLQQAEREISVVFEQQAELEREIRVAAERELVYRDLHDDLGARLLSLVFKSEQGSARDLARSALQDLRDIVSRVLSAEQLLFAVLADSMAEHESRSAALKKQFSWEIDASVDGVTCDSRRVLGLRLLLRELLGQCLRDKASQALHFSASLSDTNTLLMRLESDINARFTLPPLLRKRLRALGAHLEQSAARVITVQMPLRLNEPATGVEATTF
ncbi:MAG: hypothetical protein Q7L07_00370 [Pseudohongiella sp.]|nr:hypothetical protein [Pseudohongiella sp.]